MCISLPTANPPLPPQGVRRREFRRIAATLSQRGISLIELIMFIVIISTALAGILQVMNLTTGHSADTLVRKQALAVAESMLEEIELQDFIAAASAVPTAVTQANRATAYHIVTDYNGFTTTGIYTPDNTAVAGLGSYNLAVAVASSSALGAASAVLISVTVTDPAGQQTVMDGYRTAY